MRQVGELTVTLPSECEIRMRRTFNAPRQLVFEAMTRPELIRRWLLGPPGWTMPVCEFDARVGGAYRYLWRKEPGVEMGMRGVILEISPPERLVATERFDESWYPGEAVDTMVLEEVDGKTRLTLTVRYESQAARDAVLRTPMEQGMAMGYDRLAELLAGMA